MSEIRGLKMWVQSYTRLCSQLDDLNTMYDFFKAGEATEQETQEAFTEVLKAVEEIEFKNMLRGNEIGRAHV